MLPTLISISLFVLLQSCQPGNAQKKTGQSTVSESKVDEIEEMQKTAQLTFSDKVVGDVNANLHGFNTANMFLHFNNEAEGLELINRAGPKVLRFPGGTTANFYHFDKPGYGYSKEDAELVAGSNAYENISKSFAAEQKLLQKEGLRQNYAVDFAKTVKATNSNIVLVANIFSSPDEEILRMIDYFKEQNLQIAGIELGNENYFKAYKKVFPSVEDYIKRAKQTTTAIKSKYPELKVAVVAGSSNEIKEAGAKKADEMDAWNSALGKETFYDAYITHTYSKPKKCMEESAAPGKLACTVNVNTRFALRQLPAAIQGFKQYFGNKPCWITEWNVQGVFELTGNTFAQAAFFTDYLISLSYLPEVELATHHNLLSGGSGFNIIGERDSKEILKGSGKFTARATLLAAELVAPIFENGNKVLQLPLPVKEQIESNITVGVYETPKSYLILIVNKNIQPVSIGKLEFKNLSENPIHAISSVEAKDWSDGIGKNALKNGDFLTIRVDNKVDASSSIAPLSINRIEILK